LRTGGISWDFLGVFGKKSKSIGKILIKLTRAPMITCPGVVDSSPGVVVDSSPGKIREGQGSKSRRIQEQVLGEIQEHQGKQVQGDTRGVQVSPGRQIQEQTNQVQGNKVMECPGADQEGQGGESRSQSRESRKTQVQGVQEQSR
jgi:hypothetical protein